MLAPNHETRRRQEKRERVAQLQSDAGMAKSRLFDIERKLREIGATREANSLGKIIGRLEHWQHTGRQ